MKCRGICGLCLYVWLLGGSDTLPALLSSVTPTMHIGSVQSWLQMSVVMHGCLSSLLLMVMPPVLDLGVHVWLGVHAGHCTAHATYAYPGRVLGTSCQWMPAHRGYIDHRHLPWMSWGSDVVVDGGGNMENTPIMWYVMQCIMCVATGPNLTWLVRESSGV